jgi:hypothetical protein
MTPGASEAARPSTPAQFVMVPTEPPPDRGLVATWRIGRFHPFRFGPLAGIRPSAWSFTEIYSVPVVTVGEVRTRLVQVLGEAGLSVRTQSVDYFRPPTDASDWAPDEFVWGERSILVDPVRTWPSNAVVYALYAAALALLIVGFVGAFVYDEARVAIPGLVLGFLIGLGVWMSTSNAWYWSDIVLVGFQRSPVAPAHTKKLAREITGKLSVTTGRLFSQDYRGRGGGFRELREIYDSDRAASVKARLEEALSMRSSRLE